MRRECNGRCLRDWHFSEKFDSFEVFETEGEVWGMEKEILSNLILSSRQEQSAEISSIYHIVNSLEFHINIFPNTYQFSFPFSSINSDCYSTIFDFNTIKSFLASIESRKNSSEAQKLLHCQNET